MTVTAPETALRQYVIGVLNAEFAVDGITFRDDKLHPAMTDQLPAGGVFPSERADMASQQLVLELTCYVQIFLPWEKRIDPNQSVSPLPVEEAAERLARALEATEPNSSNTSGPHLWEAHVSRIIYPQDPTGNITRLEATIVGRAQNSALVHTTG